MHEISIAEDLAGIVLETARDNGLSEVCTVNVSFGQMIQIVPEIFRFAFSEAVRQTIASGAEINIEIIPIKLKCSGCGSEFLMGEDLFICANCGSSELQIIQGKELFIKSIEGE